jgi:REP element-mobilizing transposase RayT
MAHPPRIPIWLRWDQSVIYFVTICVADRKPVLANRQAFNAFQVAASKLEHWHILAAILMPDHLHVLVAPTKEREAKLGNFSAALKRWMREELKASWKWPRKHSGF